MPQVLRYQIRIAAALNMSHQVGGSGTRVPVTVTSAYEYPLLFIELLSRKKADAGA
jgi:hypothetical protein